MKRISNEVSRSAFGGNRKLREGVKNKELNITSLIDILTILLVFMMKNVSMDSQKNTIPKGMKVPVSYVNEKQLLEKSETILIRIYKDQVAFGVDNTIVGTLEDFVKNKNIRNALINLMNISKKGIIDNNGTPAVMVQADSDIDCGYITEFMKAFTVAKFSNIFFTTTHLETNPWNSRS